MSSVTLRRWNRRAFLAGLASGLFGCRSVPSDPRAAGGLTRYAFSEPAMGTLFGLTLYAPSRAVAETAAAHAFQRVHALNAIFSHYDSDSELMRLCAAAANRPVPVSPELMEILRRNDQLARETGGAFDMTLGPLIRLWGRARRQRRLPDSGRIQEARTRCGFEKVRLNPEQGTVTLAVDGMHLDPGGVVKGYAADEALDVLRGHGLRQALVAASGDLAIGDPPPGTAGWTVGVASIDAQARDLTETLLLHNAAISTSGDVYQYALIDGKRWSHIVDPRTGLGLEERIGVTVYARRAIDTDSLATAVSVLGARRGLDFLNDRDRVEGLIVLLESGGRRLVRTAGWDQLPRPAR